MANILFHMIGLYWHFARDRRWAKLNWSASLFILLTFHVIKLFGTFREVIFLELNSQCFCILVCNFFTVKWNRSRSQSRWKSLAWGHYRFQPIKLVNLVVPSPCERQPYKQCSVQSKKYRHWYDLTPSRPMSFAIEKTFKLEALD